MIRLTLKLLRTLFAGAAFLSVTIVANASTESLIHVRLKDRLDRPDDGYCFDILGTNRSLRVDLPLFAHNCKGGPTADSAVIYTRDGQLVFPAAEVCVTAFGVNSTVLPGTPVLLRPCGERTAFFDASRLQIFDHADDGQLRLRGSELCLAVGRKSSVTYSPADRWRALSLESCAAAEPRYSRWELVPLN